MKKIEIIVEASTPIIYYTKDNSVLAGVNVIVTKPSLFKLIKIWFTNNHNLFYIKTEQELEREHKIINEVMKKYKKSLTQNFY